jgi:redox-sensitive bicupin YhaK (pirin superfamily)
VVSGPVTTGFDLIEGRRTEVGGMPVTRVLPKRTRRTVGAWCFVDHFGPADVAAATMQIGPHPHIGLQTVTWLLDGEVVHRDSLGSEQPIRPGQLNLMTAARGVAHAEETPSRSSGSLHGVQLWVAQPETTRIGDPAFEHHATLPQVQLGAVVATILVGTLGGTRSEARSDTPLIGADLDVRGQGTLPLDPAFEHAVVVTSGAIAIDGNDIVPGSIAYLGRDRDELTVDAQDQARALLLGGEPFDEPILMWWNFVGRTRDEIAEAYRAWRDGSGRFGDVRSGLARIAAPRPSWLPLP